MITLFVTCAGSAGSPFNRAHCIDVHLPLARDCWRTYGLDRVGGLFTNDDSSGLIAAAGMFRDRKAMAAAFASPRMAEVTAGVDLVAPIKPQRHAAPL